MRKCVGELELSASQKRYVKQDWDSTDMLFKKEMASTPNEIWMCMDDVVDMGRRKNVPVLIFGLHFSIYSARNVYHCDQLSQSQVVSLHI